MAEVFQHWGGNEWQEYATRLIQQRHREHNCQVVPDGNMGDAGIDVFTFDGVVYQCYAAQPPFDELYEKQRDKLSNDIDKFVKNKEILSKILGNRNRIHRWVLLVPFCKDKKLIIHAAKKEEEVRSQALPYVDRLNFRIQITWLAHFSKEASYISSDKERENLRFTDPWSRSVWHSTLWRNEKCQRRSELSSWVEMCFHVLAIGSTAKTGMVEAKASFDDEENNPWRDDQWPVRVVQSLEILTDVTKENWNPDETTFLLMAPFLRHTALSFAEKKYLQDVKLLILPPSSSKHPVRLSYEKILGRRPQRERKLRHLLATNRPGEAKEVSWWIFHQALLADPELWELKEEPWYGDALTLISMIDPKNKIFSGDTSGGLRNLWTLARFPAYGVDDLDGVNAPPAKTTYPATKSDYRHNSFIRPLSMASFLALASRMAIDSLLLSEVIIDHVGLKDPIEAKILVKALQNITWDQSTKDFQPVLTCEHPAIDLALCDLLSDMNKIVLHCRNLPNSEITHLPFFNEHKIQPANRDYTRPHIRFSLDHEEIRELFMGEQLYEDPSLAIRELYQNALDACRYRETRLLAQLYKEKESAGWRASPAGRQPGPKARIIPAGEPPTLEEKNAISQELGWVGKIVMEQGEDRRGSYIECRDNGIGMGTFELRNCFAKAGRRFTDTDEYIAEFAEWRDMGLGHYPNSRFGIGVFSYFMITEEILVHSCRMKRKRSDQVTPIEVSVSGSGSLFRMQMAKNSEPNIGTKTRLYLNRITYYNSGTTKLISLPDSVKGWLRVAAFQTEIKSNHHTLIWNAGIFDNKNGKQVTIATRDPNIWWCTESYYSDECLLVDGIITETKIPCAVVNLHGPKNPKLTINRKKILDWDPEWLDNFMGDGEWRKLLEAEKVSMTFLWKAAESYPKAMTLWLNEVLQNSILANKIDYQNIVTWDFAQFGLFPLDYKIIDFNNSNYDYYSLRSLFSNKINPILLVERRNILNKNNIKTENFDKLLEENGIDSNTSTPELDYLSPQDAIFIADYKENETISPAHIFFAAKRHNLSVVEVTRRLATLSPLLKTVLELPQISDDNILDTLPRPTLKDRKLFTKNLDGNKPWIDINIPATHLLSASVKLELTIDQVWDKLKLFATPLGYCLPKVREDKLHDLPYPTEIDIRLFHRYVEIMLDEIDKLIHGTHILNASVNLEMSIIQVFNKLSQFGIPLGYQLPKVKEDSLTELPSPTEDDINLFRITPDHKYSALHQKITSDHLQKVASKLEKPVLEIKQRIELFAIPLDIPLSDDWYD